MNQSQDSSVQHGPFERRFVVGGLSLPRAIRRVAEERLRRSLDKRRERRRLDDNERGFFNLTDRG